MAEYRIERDAHGIRAYATEYDDVVEVPDHLCTEFLDFIDHEQPTKEQVYEWIEKAENGVFDECQHKHIEQDDDGLGAKWFVCTDCDNEVIPGEPDEDGRVIWDVAFQP